MTAFNNRQLWKVELGPKSLTKMKRWRNLENYGTRVYFIVYGEKKSISQFLLHYVSAAIT